MHIVNVVMYVVNIWVLHTRRIPEEDTSMHEDTEHTRWRHTIHMLIPWLWTCNHKIINTHSYTYTKEYKLVHIKIISKEANSFN